MNRFEGVLWGVLSGASFGLIPMFVLPLMSAGINSNTILFYRFAISAVVLGVMLLLQGKNFKIKGSQILKLLMLGVLYMASAFLLLWGYEFMPAGIATTIHFLYPVCVVLMMMFLFGERISWVNLCAVVLAVLGVALLSTSDGSMGAISMIGIIVVVISAVTYALYIIGVKKFDLADLGGIKLAFYVLLATSLLFGIKTIAFGGGVMKISGCENITNIILLALITTVLSNFALIRAIKMIGSTKTSILGALEPVTAVTVGVAFFNEVLNIKHISGMALIIVAVVVIVYKKNK